MAAGRVAHVEARWHNECSRPCCASTRNTMFAIKAEIRDLRAKSFAFNAQKTMYGGKRIAKGDAVFIFASENEGGPGLIARGVVTSARATPRKPGIERQTPRVSIAVKRTALAKKRLGRSELKPNSRTGKMAAPRPSSTSSSIARQPTRSSASRKARRRFWADSFSADRYSSRMNKHCAGVLAALLISLLLSLRRRAEDLDAWSAAKLMGVGVNIGNTLENTTTWETGWGNPRITKEFVAEPGQARIQDRARAGGLGHLRARRPHRRGQTRARGRGRRLDHRRGHVLRREHPLGRRLDRLERQGALSENVRDLQRRSGTASTFRTGRRSRATSPGGTSS